MIEVMQQIDTGKLAAKCRRLRTLKKKMEALKAEYDEIKTEIVAGMADEVEITHKGVILATYKPVNSTRFDTKQFKADYPEFYERYTITAESRRFNLK